LGDVLATVRAGLENGAPEAATTTEARVTDDIPRVLAMKIDRLLDLIAAGKIMPDPLGLLGAAVTLREHGELVRADRCVAVARRLLPNLGTQPD
jgi:hypothetical protein